MRRRGCSCWTHPSHSLGYSGESVSSVVEKFRSIKTQSAALKQFMPRRTRDYSTPSSSLSREQSLPRKDHVDGLTWSGPTGLPLRLLRVVPDLQVGMRRAASPPRGEARPQKGICPPLTRSPRSDLSQPPLGVWCAEWVHPHFSSVWQLGDAFVFPPLQSSQVKSPLFI